jgi:hypothetical protein
MLNNERINWNEPYRSPEGDFVPTGLARVLLCPDPHRLDVIGGLLERLRLVPSPCPAGTSILFAPVRPTLGLIWAPITGLFGATCRSLVKTGCW